MEWYADALQSIQAEEALRWMTIMAMGSGSVEKEEWQRIKRAWEDAMQDGEPETQKRRPSKMEYMLGLAGLGFSMDGVESLLQEPTPDTSSAQGEEPSPSR